MTASLDRSQKTGFNSVDQVDQYFLTQLNLIISKHKCKLADIDLENKVVAVDGPSTSQHECIMEIIQTLGDYLC